MNLPDKLSPCEFAGSDTALRKRQAVEAIAAGLLALRPLERLSVEVQSDGTYLVVFTSPEPGVY